MNMTAIPFIRRTAKERVDGTLTVSIDIEPKYRIDFIKMFPEIGAEGAIAALTQAASLQAAQKETIEEEKKERLGNLCMVACAFCENPKFTDWICSAHGFVKTEDFSAKEILCDLCGISSRKELDTNQEAAKIFHEQIRRPFLEWSNGQL